MAMQDVLTSPELINHIFVCIDDPDPEVACSAVMNWCATSRTIRNACHGDDSREVWQALLQRCFEKYLMAEGGRLALDFAWWDLHPRIYFEALGKAVHALRKNPITNPLVCDDGAWPRDWQWSPRTIFQFKVRHVYCYNSTYDALPQWHKAIFRACNAVEKHCYLFDW